jgi:hypothetical protein
MKARDAEVAARSKPVNELSDALLKRYKKAAKKDWEKTSARFDSADRRGAPIADKYMHKMVGREDGVNAADKRLTGWNPKNAKRQKEPMFESEVNELSNALAKRYIEKAKMSKALASRAIDQSVNHGQTWAAYSKYNKRKEGLLQASKRISEDGINELSAPLLKRYKDKAEVSKQELYKTGEKMADGFIRNEKLKTTKNAAKVDKMQDHVFNRLGVTLGKLQKRENSVKLAQRKLGEEQIDEVSSSTLKSYMKKSNDSTKDDLHSVAKRVWGNLVASKKLTKGYSSNTSDTFKQVKSSLNASKLTFKEEEDGTDAYVYQTADKLAKDTETIRGMRREMKARKKFLAASGATSIDKGEDNAE